MKGGILQAWQHATEVLGTVFLYRIIQITRFHRLTRRGSPARDSSKPLLECYCERLQMKQGQLHATNSRISILFSFTDSDE